MVGAGGFGRETLDVIEAHNLAGVGERIRVLGVADDSPSSINLQRLSARGITHLGMVSEVIGTYSEVNYVLGVGNPIVKRKLAQLLDDAGWGAKSLVHPSANIGSVVEIGAGSVICGGVQLSTNTSLGRHVHLNPNATIGHDSTLGDFVSVNPGAIVSGEVEIGADSLVGAGAVILQGLGVGQSVIVGAAACVTKDTETGLTVVGVPARAR